MEKTLILFTITPNAVWSAGVILNPVRSSHIFFKIVMCGRRSKAQE